MCVNIDGTENRDMLTTLNINQVRLAKKGTFKKGEKVMKVTNITRLLKLVRKQGSPCVEFAVSSRIDGSNVFAVIDGERGRQETKRVEFDVRERGEFRKEIKKYGRGILKSQFHYETVSFTFADLDGSSYIVEYLQDNTNVLESTLSIKSGSDFYDVYRGTMRGNLADIDWLREKAEILYEKYVSGEIYQGVVCVIGGRDYEKKITE